MKRILFPLVLVSLFALVGCGHSDSPSQPEPVSKIKELPELEADSLRALNAIRRNPASYIDRLRAFLPLFQGKNMLIGSTRFHTTEGAPAVEEAIQALAAQTACGVIENNALLKHAALDHITDQILNGGEGHYGKDGSSPFDRMERYAKMREAGEIITYNTYGGEVTGAAVMASFVIDDGVPDRGHRHGVFHQTFTHAGVACGESPKWGPLCVIDLALDPIAK